MAGPGSFRIERLTGERLVGALPDLARLRIEVFRAYPYLYDGSLDYETSYLREFAAADGAVLIAALDGDRVVGASTASPMLAQKEDIAAPFRASGEDISTLFYFGESVLLPQYRGRGMGHAFFDQREAAALEQGASAATFASVVRPENHPARPEGYRSNDAFWTRRGYRPVPGVIMALSWVDIGDREETAKPLQFWMRRL